MSYEQILVIPKDHLDFLNTQDDMRAAKRVRDADALVEIYLPEQLYQHHNAVVYVTAKAEQGPLWDRFKHATIGRNITFKPLDTLE